MSDPSEVNVSPVNHPGSNLSAVLIYPNTRDVAFASLGFLKVFEMLKRQVALADVSYLPESQERGLSRSPILSPKQKLLLGHFTGREVRRFDIIAFSVSYENDFIHVPELLIGSGVEPRAVARGSAFPLVVFGGFVMSMNPLPIADFADAVVVGEAEPVIDPVLSAVSEAREGPQDKGGLLAQLPEIPGVWVPSLRQTSVKRLWAPTGTIAPEAPAEARSHFGDMYLVEVGRGCGRGCLFCAAGNLYRPVRMRERSEVLGRAREAKKVGLVGTAVGDHPSLVPILRDLVQAGCKVGISSFRADEMTSEIAGLLAQGDMRSLAIAPEAGSETLRHSIGKTISDEQLVAAVTTLADAGITTIKLYFMIGLPGEADRDIEAIVDLVQRLSRVRGRARLAVAVGPFVPKPHTAFQWSGFADMKTLKRRVGMLSAIRSIRGCSLKVGSLEEAWLEALLTRGDRSLGPLLLEAAEQGVPFKRLARQLLRGRPDLDPCRALDMEKPLPWDFIESGFSEKRLK